MAHLYLGFSEQCKARTFLVQNKNRDSLQPDFEQTCLELSHAEFCLCILPAIVFQVSTYCWSFSVCVLRNRVFTFHCSYRPNFTEVGGISFCAASSKPCAFLDCLPQWESSILLVSYNRSTHPLTCQNFDD